MHTAHRSVVTAALVLYLPVAALAQSVETRPLRLYGPANTRLEAAAHLDGDDVSSLEHAFLAGDLPAAQKAAQQMMCAATVTDAKSPPWTCSGQTLNLARTSGMFFVVWAGKDVAGAWTLRRMLVPGYSNRPFTLDLSGIGASGSSQAVYEVFLASDRRAMLSSAYKSTRSDNPVLAQIPSVATTILTPFFAVAGAVNGFVSTHMPAFPEGPTVQTPTVWVTASRVPLPYDRATTTVNSRAQLATSVDDLAKSARKIADQASFENAGKSEVAQRYASRLADAVPGTAINCVALADWTSCLASFNTAFNEADRQCQAGCLPSSPASAPPALTDDDKAAKRSVEAKFRTFVEGLPTVVSTDASFVNRPLTHFGFGTLTGYIASNWSAGRARVKLDNNGHVVADPLPRPFTMVILNWSRKGYDSGSFRPTPKEVNQWFVGAVIAPDTGFAAGGTHQIIRGLALNAGAGVMLSKGLNAGDVLGQAPASGTEPFALSVTPFLFVGASVNFSGK